MEPKDFYVEPNGLVRKEYVCHRIVSHWTLYATTFAPSLLADRKRGLREVIRIRSAEVGGDLVDAMLVPMQNQTVFAISEGVELSPHQREPVGEAPMAIPADDDSLHE